MVDTKDLKSFGRKAVRVRVSFWASKLLSAVFFSIDVSTSVTQFLILSIIFATVFAIDSSLPRFFFLSPIDFFYRLFNLFNKAFLRG